MTMEYAAPSRRLERLWSEWIELHSILDNGISQKRPKKERPAVPFLSAVSKAKCQSRILFVGKATNHELCGDSYRKCKSVEQAIHDRLLSNLTFVQQRGNGKAFWNLFCRLAARNTNFGLDSIIWSNVAKIGSLESNPSGLLLSAQADLAERTLRAEIDEYQPVLTIFLVSGQNKELSRIVDLALGARKWIKSEEVDPRSDVPDVWWTKEKEKPAVLWTRHPQGARKNEIVYWLKKAQELMGS